MVDSNSVNKFADPPGLINGSALYASCTAISRDNTSTSIGEPTKNLGASCATRLGIDRPVVDVGSTFPEGHGLGRISNAGCRDSEGVCRRAFVGELGVAREPFVEPRSCPLVVANQRIEVHVSDFVARHPPGRIWALLYVRRKLDTATQVGGDREGQRRPRILTPSLAELLERVDDLVEIHIGIVVNGFVDAHGDLYWAQCRSPYEIDPRSQRQDGAQAQIVGPTRNSRIQLGGHNQDEAQINIDRVAGDQHLCQRNSSGRWVDHLNRSELGRERHGDGSEVAVGGTYVGVRRTARRHHGHNQERYDPQLHRRRALSQNPVPARAVVPAHSPGIALSTSSAGRWIGVWSPTQSTVPPGRSTRSSSAGNNNMLMSKTPSKASASNGNALASDCARGARSGA
ncbi:hypothetical protein GQR58_029231 [Nymphon striatum]|nr:hypothetical protein GQR58_029231 [Nymphon striatum]